MKHFVLNREFGIVRTVAVFGPGRGGTSLIAGCEQALGVSMGIAPHAYKHEWSPIVRQANSKVDLPQTHQNIQRMNASFPCWGWKFPSDVFHIDAVAALLRNPGFIVVTRDLTEIALSSLARQDVPFDISLHQAAIVSQYIANRIRFWPWPILLVPFAEPLREPKSLVEILCDFLQIDPDEAQRRQAADFVQPLTRGYRPFDAKPDQLQDFSPPADDLKDSQNLAIDLSARCSREFSHSFEELLAHTSSAADRLGAQIRNQHDLKMASEVINDLAGLFEGCVTADGRGINWPRANDGFGSAKQWRAAVSQLLENLSKMSRRAADEALHSSGDYDALMRLRRALHLLIRVRTALDAGLHRIKFESAA
jgi:hypothetical protein